MGADSGHVVHANPSPECPPLTPERHRGVGQDAFTCRSQTCEPPWTDEAHPGRALAAPPLDDETVGGRPPSDLEPQSFVPSRIGSRSRGTSAPMPGARDDECHESG